MTDSLVFSVTFLNVFGRVASPCLFHSELASWSIFGSLKMTLIYNSHQFFFATPEFGKITSSF